TSSFNWRTSVGYFRFAQCTAPQKGTAHFIVTACSGGTPISNAPVSIDGSPYGATLSDGTYDAVSTPGSHSYFVSKTGVGSQSGNFSITNGQTTNVPVCLGASPTATATPTPTPPQIALAAQGRLIHGQRAADLSWSGATSNRVDVYRDGVLIITTRNDGFYTDRIGGTGTGTFTYQVCNQGTQTCSNQATVTF